MITTKRDVLPGLVTRAVICERLDLPLWRVEYLLQSRDVRPVGRAGRTWLYPDTAVDQLRGIVDRLDAVEADRRGRVVV